MKEILKLILIKRPVLWLILVFALLIGISSVPIFFFEKGGFDLSIVDALFTGSSASTVTGLVVVSTSDLSFLSQITILAVIELGGLLAISGGAFIMILAGKIGATREGKISAASLTLIGVGWDKFWETLRFILLFSFMVQALSAILLFLNFQNSMDGTEAFWNAIFHAVSAFYGAGFYLFPDNLYSFRGDPFLLSVTMAETILGGIGILVILSIKVRILSFIKEIVFQFGRKMGFYHFEGRSKIYGWPVHVKLVMYTTTVLILAGFVAFWALESSNVLVGMSWKEQFWVSLFQSVSARTAGFSTVDMGAITPATQFFYDALMFIGAGSVSASGGIKVTTFAVCALLIWASIKRRDDVTFGWRVIPKKTTSRASGVFWLSFIVLFLFVFLLLVFEKAEFGDVLFEASSAFGTVGYSSGITSSLTDVGKILLSVLMLIGRIGPLALTYLLGRDIIEDKSAPMKLEEEVEVG